ncbi:hypothetical protein BADSM9389_13780 [Buttiauxella agrestis]|nr:hypothetical protein BADSM9389_13780 [Buttiauxella agrestis]
MDEQKHQHRDDKQCRDQAQQAFEEIVKHWPVSLFYRPHPGPLPLGEGENRIVPSPGGEG